MRAVRALRNRIDSWRRLLETQGKLLTTLSYQSVLHRGFALVRNEAGIAVRSATELELGARLEFEFADGRVRTDVTHVELNDPNGARRKASGVQPTPAKPARRKGGGGPQGSLF